MEFPVCYILVCKQHGTYVSNSGHTLCKYEYVVEEYSSNIEKCARYFTSNIELAKRWASYKKVKLWLGKNAKLASFYDVVGSDQTIIPAADLLK